MTDNEIFEEYCTYDVPDDYKFTKDDKAMLRKSYGFQHYLFTVRWDELKRALRKIFDPIEKLLIKVMDYFYEKLEYFL